MRLVGMIIKPLKDADYSLVELRGERPTPHCKKHGAMNKFTPEIWRCCSTYKFEKVAGQSDKHPGKFKENNCLAGCEEVLNTSSSNDAHTKTDARFGGSGADDVLCADVPSSPVASQDNRGTSTDERCPSGATQSKDSESAVSDQDGAKPSTSPVEYFARGFCGGDMNCECACHVVQDVREVRAEMWAESLKASGGDEEKAYLREGGKPSTSPIVVHDVETVRSVAGHIRMKLIEQGLTDEKLKEVFDSLDKDSFSSGKGESGSVTANASGNHSAAYQQGGLTEPDENGGKSGGESASVQPTSFTATSVSPRPEEPCEVCGSDCVCCCPVCKIGPPTPPYCDHHIHCMCHPEHSKVYHLGRKHERSKVLDEVEAKIKAIPLYAKDAKVQDYSAGYANAHDSLKRKVIDLLGAMRK